MLSLKYHNMGASALNMDRDLPNFGGTKTTQEDKEKEVLVHPLASAPAKGNSKRKPEIARRIWKPVSLALEKKKLEKKLLHKDEKLHELKNRCAHLLKVEKHCNDLHKELNLKKAHVEVLTKSQTCMQQQVDNADRKHTEDLTLLVRALEKSKADLGSQHRLIEILVQDLQKMKSTLEYCKDELMVKDERVSILEEDLKRAKHHVHESRGKLAGTVPSKIHRTHASSLLQTLSKRKYVRPHWQPLPIAVRNDDHEQQCNLDCETWQKERSELQAKVAKLTQEGELWKFEKTMLVSALRAAKKEFNHQHKKLNALEEKLRDQKTRISSKPNCSACEIIVPHCQCHRVPAEKQRPQNHCAVCKKREPQLSNHSGNIVDHSGNNHIVVSLGEELRKQMQSQYDVEEKLRGTEKQLSHSNKKLRSAERERAEMTAELAHARMRSYDMEYQMALLHDSLLESSARLEHVTSQLRDSCHQRVSVQKSLECSLVNLQEASVDVVLENSAKELEFKSMKLLQRLMATRLRWGNTVATNNHAVLIEN